MARTNPILFPNKNGFVSPPLFPSQLFRQARVPDYLFGPVHVSNHVLKESKAIGLVLIGSLVGQSPGIYIGSQRVVAMVGLKQDTKVYRGKLYLVAVGQNQSLIFNRGGYAVFSINIWKGVSARARGDIKYKNRYYQKYRQWGNQCLAIGDIFSPLLFAGISYHQSLKNIRKSGIKR